MPRFFLHIHEGDQVAWDPDGVERASVQDAIDAAVEGVREVLSGQVIAGRLHLGGVVVITDEADAEVGRVQFRDVVTISGE